MGIPLSSQFDVQTALPLDSRLVVADTTARDALSALIRYEGMIVYVTADGLNYQLIGGITNSDWEQLSGSGGGGGGGSLRFIEGSNAPIKTFENEIEVYEFTPGLGQALYLAIRVPNSYQGGNQINLRIHLYCAATSGDALLNAVATLISAEADDISSTANQRTTTNTAITMSAANDNEVQRVTLDISSSIGEINSTVIGANDLIKVKIQESSSTVASSIKLIPDSAEVTFS